MNYGVLKNFGPQALLAEGVTQTSQLNGRPLSWLPVGQNGSQVALVVDQNQLAAAKGAAAPRSFERSQKTSMRQPTSRQTKEEWNVRKLQEYGLNRSRDLYRQRIRPAAIAARPTMQAPQPVASQEPPQQKTAAISHALMEKLQQSPTVTQQAAARSGLHVLKALAMASPTVALATESLETALKPLVMQMQPRPRRRFMPMAPAYA